MDFTASHFSGLPSPGPISSTPSMHTASGIAMGQSYSTKRQAFVCSPTIVGERVCGFLRRLYPDRTVDNVVADLAPWDIKASTIAKMLERHTSPGTILWMALIWAYGPEFLSEVHPAPLGWLSAASREQKQRAIEALRDELEKIS